MSDWYEANKAIAEVEQSERAARRDAALSDLEAAQVAAERAGLRLRICSPTQYQLEHPTRKWLLNIYPGNRRVYADRNRPKAPYLRLPLGWTLLDVVRAAIARS